MPASTTPDVSNLDQQDKLPGTGDKMPDIPGVERIIMVDGISGNDGVKIDALENATKDSSMPVMKKFGCKSALDQVCC